MVARFLFFVFFISVFATIAYLVIRYLFKPGIKKAGAIIKHDVDTKEIIVDKEISDMKDAEERLKKSLNGKTKKK